MKILLSAMGSRGDVQPFLALAFGLKRAGHAPTLAVPHNFTEWVESYGVAAHPLPFSAQDFLERPELQKHIKTRNVLRQLQIMRNEMAPVLVRTFQEYWKAVPGMELVVQTGTGLGAFEAAQLHRLPLAFAFLQPFQATRAFPSFFLPMRVSLGGGYNYATHQLMERALWSTLGFALNRWRAALGLPPLKSLHTMLSTARAWGSPTFYGFSPSLVPRPPDWSADQHITGYWFLDPPPDWRPPPHLQQFLDSGPPPIYIGFGSMRDDHPERLTQLVLRALEISHQRGVLLTGWGGLTEATTPPSVCFVDNVPHAWLFPRMAAVLHHGGAGTTGAGLRAGVPSLITPFALDQYAWAEQVQRLGVGPRLPAMQQATPEKLAAALHQAVHDPTVRTRAAALGERIRAEAGLAQAVDGLERHVAAWRQAGMVNRANPGIML